MGVLTLQRVRATAAPQAFPHRILEGSEDALILFSSAFYGAQDAIWIARAGLKATCVDTDTERLDTMLRTYPDNWEFVAGDVFDYATLTGRRWDVVTVDCPSNLFGRCAELLPLWCLLAKRAVVLGTGIDTKPVPPDGWMITERLQRSRFLGGVFWTVAELC